MYKARTFFYFPKLDFFLMDFSLTVLLLIFTFSFYHGAKHTEPKSQHCTRPSTQVISLNPHDDSVGSVLLSLSFTDGAAEPREVKTLGLGHAAGCGRAGM